MESSNPQSKSTGYRFKNQSAPSSFQVSVSSVKYASNLSNRVDPLGVLEEGQIYYCSSQPLKDLSTQTLFTVLKGPVLVGVIIV